MRLVDISSGPALVFKLCEDGHSTAEVVASRRDPGLYDLRRKDGATKRVRIREQFLKEELKDAMVDFHNELENAT